MSDLIPQVQNILRNDKTPYKHISLSTIPRNVLSSYLQFHQPGTSDQIKKQLIPELVQYGFIAHGYLKELHGNNQPKQVTHHAPPIQTHIQQQYQQPIYQPAPQPSFVQPQQSSLNRITTTFAKPGGCKSCPNVV